MRTLGLSRPCQLQTSSSFQGHQQLARHIYIQVFVFASFMARLSWGPRHHAGQCLVLGPGAVHEALPCMMHICRTFSQMWLLTEGPVIAVETISASLAAAGAATELAAEQQMSELSQRFQPHLSLTKTRLDACRQQMIEVREAHRQLQAELGIEGESDVEELVKLAYQYLVRFSLP